MIHKRFFLNLFGGWGPRYATRMGVVCELTNQENYAAALPSLARHPGDGRHAARRCGFCGLSAREQARKKEDYESTGRAVETN